MQEQQVPVHARVIAGSATTSILTNQVVQQQYELQKVEKRMEDMKAALHLACGVLRQTNYMDDQVGGCCLSCICNHVGMFVVSSMSLLLVPLAEPARLAAVRFPAFACLSCCLLYDRQLQQLLTQP